MPKKPVYFVDLVRRVAHELPADGIPRSFGRGTDCNIETLSPEDISRDYTDSDRKLAKSVSRLQGRIIHDKVGYVTIIPIGESPMWIGTEENSRELFIKRSELFLYGNYLTIGRGYRFVLRQYKDEEPVIKMELHGRIQETDVIKNFHP